jgi:CTP synthase (UTP-ammonia lyase)
VKRLRWRFLFSSAATAPAACYDPFMAAGTALVGVIGDLDLPNPTHRFTNKALAHAGCEYAWVPTDEIGRSSTPVPLLGRFGGLLIAPGSPYRDMEGAIAAVRYARERGVPLVGT